MVDKDNTHFSYKFECDKVIDETDAKLVILRKLCKTRETIERADTKIHGDNIYETIAVFNVWTFWRIIKEKTI